MTIFAEPPSLKKLKIRNRKTNLNAPNFMKPERRIMFMNALYFQRAVIGSCPNPLCTSAIITPTSFACPKCGVGFAQYFEDSNA